MPARAAPRGGECPGRLRLVPFTSAALPSLEPWFDNAETQRWLGDRRWPQMLLRPGREPSDRAPRQVGRVATRLDPRRGCCPGRSDRRGGVHRPEGEHRPGRRARLPRRGVGQRALRAVAAELAVAGVREVFGRGGGREHREHPLPGRGGLHAPRPAAWRGRLPLLRLRALDARCSARTVLASNTSSLLPSALPERASHPERLRVVHYFFPVHLLPAVEVVPGPHVCPGHGQRQHLLSTPACSASSPLGGLARQPVGRAHDKAGAIRPRAGCRRPTGP